MHNEQLLCPVLHQHDMTGVVYIYQNVVRRHISKEFQGSALRLLESDLLRELISKRLFPKTWISQDISDNCGNLIIEHERAPFILQGWEWSFSMLKDAALVILDVADLCSKYGYILQDAHVYNVVFFSCVPMFVDFGSFRESQSCCSLPQKEFLRNSYLPLKLWSEGNFYIANRLLADKVQDRRLQPFSNAADIPLFRNYYKLFRERYKWKDWLKVIANMVIFQAPILRNYLFDVSHCKKISYSSEEIRRKIISIPAPDIKTEWESYHDNNFKTKQVSHRFRRIIEIISRYDWKTAVDVAGNSGYFTELLAQHFKNSHFLCLDYDSRVIEKQYNRLCRSENMMNRISLGMVNIMYPDNFTMNLEDKINADLVIALALTHHLILRQKANIKIILQLFYRIARKYLVIEFMPIGLWDGKTDPPPVPEWYTKEWFKKHLMNNFIVLTEEELGRNRIVFFCEKIIFKKL